MNVMNEWKDVEEFPLPADEPFWHYDGPNSIFGVRIYKMLTLDEYQEIGGVQQNYKGSILCRDLKSGEYRNILSGFWQPATNPHCQPDTAWLVIELENSR